MYLGCVPVPLEILYVHKNTMQGKEILRMPRFKNWFAVISCFAITLGFAVMSCISVTPCFDVISSIAVVLGFAVMSLLIENYFQPTIKPSKRSNDVWDEERGPTKIVSLCQKAHPKLFLFV